jgi:hypothetical protein
MPPTEAALLIFGPCLLAAFALEHAYRSATYGIKHGPNLRRLLAALIARWNWVGMEAGKDLILEIAVHRAALAIERLVN